MAQQIKRFSLVLLALALCAGGHTLVAQISPGGLNTNNLEKYDAGSGDPKLVAQDRLFVADAYQGGLAEIQLGQLAADKGNSDAVKNLGKQMVADHTKLNDALKQAAGTFGATVPGKPSKKDDAEYKKLNGMNGAAFDTEYLAYMDKDHKKDLSDFQQEEGRTQNPALHQVTAQGDAMIAGHIKMIQQAAGKTS